MKIPATFELPPLKPGAYVRLRRESAGLGIDEVALRLAARPADERERTHLADILEALEGDEHFGRFAIERQSLVWQLVPVFPIDPSVYLALMGFAADSDLPCPRVCRGCGCNWNDACIGEGGMPCHWTGPGDLCSLCEADDPPPAEEAPPIGGAELRNAA